MKTFVIIFMVLLAFTSHADTSIKVVDPWIPAAPPGASVFAGYLSLNNTAAEDIVITGFSSPRFGRIEMHRTVVEHGMATMTKQSILLIPARDSLKLEPQGLHLMLMKPTQPVALGEEIPFSAHADDGRTISFEAVVKTPTAP